MKLFWGKLYRLKMYFLVQCEVYDKTYKKVAIYIVEFFSMKLAFFEKFRHPIT